MRKLLKVVAVEKMFCVLFEGVGAGGAKQTESAAVVKVLDEETGQTHFARWNGGGGIGGGDGEWYLPGGCLYLGDTFAEALVALGIDK